MKHRKLFGFFLATLCFLHASWAAPSAPPPSQAETLQLLKLGKWAELDQRFSAVQAAYRTGDIDDEKLRAAFRVLYVTDEWLAPRYDAWVKQFPKSYVANLARGIYFKRLGQERRGTEFANKTSDEAFRGMDAAFDEAKRSLEASMSLDSKPILSYLYIIDISRHRSNYLQSRDWFQRSLQIDPRNFIVREKYMDTLRRRWGGSLEKMTELLEQSRQAGVSSPHLRALQAMVADERAFEAMYEEKNYASAVKAYREVESLGGDLCDTCFAQALVHDRQYAEALKVFDRILRANPKDADSLGRRGNVHISLNQPVEAIADFQAAGAMGDGYAQSQLGYFYLEGIPRVLASDPDVGIEWLRKSAAQGNALGQEYLQKVEKYLREHPQEDVKPVYKRR